MKISKIKISKFHQFEDFELDLTYPKGHEKEGKPLDKVCFIGQSGTGKTTLLEMIKHACTPYLTPSIRFESDLFSTSDGEDFGFFRFYREKDKYSEESYMDVSVAYNDDSKKLDDPFEAEEPIARALLYFATGLSNADLTQSMINSFEKKILIEPNKTYRPRKAPIKELNFHQVTKDSIKSIWEAFYQLIQNHQQDEANFKLNLINRFEKEKIDISKELSNWRSQHPNPIEIVAKECLNPILKQFQLAVKTEVDDVRQLHSLQISSLFEKTTIPYEFLSTGTKQIIFTAFPIYQLLEDDSIVLMDEPETSLYPDIQREIIPYYTSFDKNKTSQFFFATHSPIIASAFEPWEIVELKFDEKGKVYRDKYYEGENHVNNYRLDAQILRYDQILTRIFDLSGDSDAKRAEKLQELAILKNKVERLKKEEMDKPSAETQKIINEYLQLSDDISGTWALSRHEKN